MQDLIVAFLSSHPQLSVVISVIVVLRAVFKPLMAVLEAGVQASGSDSAKVILANAEASPFYKGLSFLLDYFASVKLPVVAAAVQAKKQ